MDILGNANLQFDATLTPDHQWLTALTAANATADLTSGTSYDVFTAAQECYLQEARLKANPANNTAATIWRVWLNNGSTKATAGNSVLLGEVPIPAITASTTIPNPTYTFPLGFVVPTGYKVVYTLSIAPGGSGAFMGMVLANQ